MERKVSRRGPHPDHLHLDKSMISGPTNFSHVGRSDPFRDRLGEWAEGETQVGGGVKDHRWAEVSEEERQEREGEGEQGGEYDPCPVSPPSPNTERRSSRRISKDMISLPMNFRHVLHIDPSSADPEHLSLLLKSGTEMEYDLECDEEEEEEEEEEEQQEEEEEEENENEDPAWPPPEPPVDYHEGTKGAPDPAPAKPRALRPSNRVRKSMISLPTNFQHVNHISAGERLLAPESPPPQVPPEPQPGGEGHEEKEWRYKTSPCTPPVIPFPPPPQISPNSSPHRNFNTPNVYFPAPSSVPPPPRPPSPTYVNLPLPTHHPNAPPPLSLPTSNAPPSPAPLSAPPHLGTNRGKSHVTLGGPDPDQDPDGVRFHGGDSNFDFNIVQFRVPPPPPFQFCGNDVSRSSLPSRPRAHHQHLIEEEARRERRNDSMEEEGEEGEEEEGGWRRNEKRLTMQDRCHEEARRPPPLDVPPPPPPTAPPAVSRRRSIGRPTNFQHVRHLDAHTAELLLEECAEEIAARNGEKRRGRERESERVRERRAPSLPPAFPHTPRSQDTAATGKLRKPVIGHPTNFQHVAHVGFGSVHGPL